MPSRRSDHVSRRDTRSISLERSQEIERGDGFEPDPIRGADDGRGDRAAQIDVEPGMAAIAVHLRETGDPGNTPQTRNPRWRIRDSREESHGRRMTPPAPPRRGIEARTAA